jgi:hypothetical protein
MDQGDTLSLIFRAAVGAVVIVAAYLILFGRRAEFVIEVRKGTVRGKGKIAQAVVHRLTPFLLHDLGITDSVRILGTARGRQMRVWFRGRINPGQQQRIRNFLNSPG